VEWGKGGQTSSSGPNLAAPTPTAQDHKVTSNRQVAQTSQPLDAIGLGPAEAEVYNALVRHPLITATELAERVDGRAQWTASVLSRLLAAGLASRVPGHEVRYQAVSPSLALGSRLTSQESQLRAARDLVDELETIHREAARFSHPAEMIEVVTGTENIAVRVSHVQASAHHQVRGFDKPPYVSKPGANLSTEQSRIADGVKYRVIYSAEAAAWPGRMTGDILPGLATGEQARIATELPMKLFLADDLFAVIPITSSEHVVDAAYIVHPCALLDALITLFEAEWERALPVGQPAAAAARPDPETAAMLALLAAGQTDAGIARSLRWSERTTQRRVHKLMEDLGATSRFQAGLAAQRRGWV
jgi:hypothetical protein